MAYTAVTYSFSANTTIDNSQVNQNFTDIINGLSDASKDLSINALTVAGNFTANGTTNTIGNAASDTLAITAGILSDIIPAATHDATYYLGSATLAWLGIYLSGNGFQHKLQGNSTSAADITVTLPVATGTLMTLGNAEAVTGQKTFTAPILGTPASGTLTNCTGLPISTGLTGYTAQTSLAPTLAFSGGNGSGTLSTTVGRYTIIGTRYFFSFYGIVTKGTGSGNLILTMPQATTNITNLYQGFAVQDFGTLTYVAAATGVFAYMAKNAAALNFMFSRTALATTAITAADMGATFEFAVGGSYEI